MNHLLDDEQDDRTNGHRDRANGQRDREITLGTTTVLGIFFGLAILCAAFFGFGYSLGSKHATTNITPTGEQLQTRIGGAKPAPGSLVGSNPYAPVGPGNTTAPTTTPPATSVAPRPVTPPAGAAASPEAFEADQPVVKPPRTPPPAPAAPVAAMAAPAPATPAVAQQLVVQVAALSHQEDADLIRTTLERRGYAVAIRPDANDKLLHVQIGPFNTRKDAETMRQKLLSDGFNAYIK